MSRTTSIIASLLAIGAILSGEAGKKFYYRALSSKAKRKKRKRRQMARESRRRNRQ